MIAKRLYTYVVDHCTNYECCKLLVYTSTVTKMAFKSCSFLIYIILATKVLFVT